MQHAYWTGRGAICFKAAQQKSRESSRRRVLRLENLFGISLNGCDANAGGRDVRHPEIRLLFKAVRWQQFLFRLFQRRTDGELHCVGAGPVPHG